MNKSLVLAISAGLLAACAADDSGTEGVADVEEVSTRAAESPVSFTALESISTGMRVRFTMNDPQVAVMTIHRLALEDGFYKKLATVPLSPSGSYSHVDTTAQLGKEFCYQIMTRRAGETRQTGSSVRCRIHDAGLPTLIPRPPLDAKISLRFDRSLRVSVTDDSTNEAGFSLEQQVFGVWQPVKTVASSPGKGNTVHLFAEDLDVEEEYCLRVRSFNLNGSNPTFAVCGTTTPVLVSEPLPHPEDPRILRITHPAPGALTVQWHTPDPGRKSKVRVYDGLEGGWLLGLAHEDESANPPNIQTHTIPDLEPGKLYCITISDRSNRVCDSPKAARTLPSHRDPRPEATPHITAIYPHSNTSLDIRLANPQPGQFLELSRQSVRHSFWEITGDATQFIYNGLSTDTEYCFRVVTFNDWGVRYSSAVCETTAAAPPARPDGLAGWLSGDQVYFGWQAVGNATSYEVKWLGTRPATQDLDGSEIVSGTSHHIYAYAGFDFCFEVRARNEFGVSSWAEKCGIVTPEEGEHADTYYLKTEPSNAAQIYLATVQPNGGGNLVRLRPLGNDATPYTVHFLPPGTNFAYCGSDEVGVKVEPGNALTSQDLVTLYGSQEPSLPLELRACKVEIDTDVDDNGIQDAENLSDVLVEVTWRP